MTDIYDIKTILLWMPFSIIYSLIYIFLIIWIYFLSKYLNKNKLNKKEIKIDYVQKIKENVDYENIFRKLEKDYKELKPNIFYKNLSYIVRWYLEQEKNINNISKMTFEEIQKLKLGNEKEKLIKKIYFNEFRENINDNEEIRKKILREIEILIFK